MEHSSDLDMDGEGFFKIPTSNTLNGGSETTNIHSYNEADIDQHILAANYERDSAVISTTLQVGVEVNESIPTIENGISVINENGSAVEDRSSSANHNHKRNGSYHEIDAVSGTKRPRINVDEQQASVHVIYNSLTRKSKQKLEELLQKWSEWHTQHQSSSSDSKGELVSGEGTYFPALDFGLDKHSAVSFWIDGQTSNSQSKELIAVDNSSIPLYDRGYSFGLTSTDGSSKVDGGLEIVNASRCFNCGSYNHSLKECQKPRDNAAVDSARKQHKALRNQNSSSRNPTRYYQDTPRGKFDGLRPGVLDPETRKLLGIGELDPPPWLNRMRELGYPPGYLDLADDDQPSGILIFDDVVVKQETDNREVLRKDFPLPPPVSPPPPPGSPPPPPPPPEPPRKMSVRFPGVNAPIPENADEWRWGAKAWKFDSPKDRSYNSTEPKNKPHYHDQRWARDYRDVGPPGVDHGSSPLVSTFSRWYAGYDSRSPTYERSLYERSRSRPLIHETTSLPYYHQEHHHHSWR